MREKAVALAYDPKEPATPIVVATGEGAFARQILDVAFANDVKVREDASLVEILSALEVGSEIPVIALTTVAEILSHVYHWEISLHPLQAEKGPTEKGQAEKAAVQ